MSVMQTMDTATAGGLRGILEGLLRIDGVTAALVVGRDGFVIEAVSSDAIETDSVGAIAASSLATSEAMGGELHLGPLGSILIEFEQGPVAVSPAGPEAVLAVVGNQHVNLGRLRIEMRKIRTAVANQL
ncbi:MAG: roadblock/LC7 domain-containing protein [Armatimonadota bacterium]|nr:roadblock/LC7 domain-containing protein [Armatimonadota bacterium]MDR7450423.1 roadblock/LC7 domain-containing protein [Armatimonadota bacterium]MDR7466994.1 roadblock/LC7 domain-containing protein [Armatimonadota bacterium]MDR7493464.1 roadblock/LC7 domain-containing protein [Armatimonadota bacterium]MDR7498729.1 roadblock/LC7 domain-containing protein [Armatimonadota bacterium]